MMLRLCCLLITGMWRIFKILIPDSSINPNDFRILIFQKRRDDCHKGELSSNPEYELARNAINSTEPLAGNRLVAGCYKAE